MGQPIKNIARRIGERERIRDARGDAGTGGPTAHRRGQVAALNQTPAGNILPGHRHAVTRVRDIKGRGAGGLHHVDERPETAGHRVIAAAHRAAGIGLADGAAHLIRSARAGTAAGGDFIPVHGVSLGGGAGGKWNRRCKPRRGNDG